jgi:hypothetical protein
LCNDKQKLRIHYHTRHLCSTCGLYFPHSDTHTCQSKNLIEHDSKSIPKIRNDFFKEIFRAHGGSIVGFKFNPIEKFVTFDSIFSHVEKEATILLKQLLSAVKTLKVLLRFYTELRNLKTNESHHVYLGTEYMILLHPAFIPQFLVAAAGDVISTLNLYSSRGSGHVLKQINSMELRVAMYEPLRPRGINSNKLPPILKFKRGLHYIPNEDSYCFMYCICAHFYRRKVGNSKKPESYYQFFKKFNTSGIEFPVSFLDIKTFENKNNLSINLYMIYKDKTIAPVQLTDTEKPRHFDLCVIEIEEDQFHYVLITNIQKFLGQSNKGKHHYCRHCLTRYKNELSLMQHVANCKLLNKTKLLFPIAKYLEFKNYERTYLTPFSFFFDFECFLKPVDKANLTIEKQNLQKNLEKNKPIILQKKLKTYNENFSDGRDYVHIHEICSYGLAVVGPNGLISYETFNSSQGDVVKHFLTRILQLGEYYVAKIRATNNTVTMTEEEKLYFQNATHCSFCKCEFTKENPKNNHHHHIDFKKNGSNHLFVLCGICNRKASHRPVINAYSHNGVFYDQKIVVCGFKQNLIKSIKILPYTDNHFLNIKINNVIKFVDSMKIMNGSLDNLVKNLKEGVSSISDLRKKFQILDEGIKCDDVCFGLLTSKLDFPYTFMKGNEVFGPKIGLPAQHHFDNDLKQEKCTKQAYDKTKKIYKLIWTFIICTSN